MKSFSAESGIWRIKKGKKTGTGIRLWKPQEKVP
jgi:hypothetical protein